MLRCQEAAAIVQKIGEVSGSSSFQCCVLKSTSTYNNLEYKQYTGVALLVHTKIFGGLLI